MTKQYFLFDPHAVRRLISRRVPYEAVLQIAEFGVTVQESSLSKMKRGEVNGMAVHVVVLKEHIIKTVYFADEWVSKVTVERIHA